MGWDGVGQQWWVSEVGDLSGRVHLDSRSNSVSTLYGWLTSTGHTLCNLDYTHPSSVYWQAKFLKYKYTSQECAVGYPVLLLHIWLDF